MCGAGSAEAHTNASRCLAPSLYIQHGPSHEECRIRSKLLSRDRDDEFQCPDRRTCFDGLHGVSDSEEPLQTAYETSSLAPAACMKIVSPLCSAILCSRPLSHQPEANITRGDVSARVCRTCDNIARIMMPGTECSLIPRKTSTNQAHAIRHFRS